MTTERDELVDRIRAELGGERTTAEKSMFGVIAFMVNGKMLVCAQRDGGLLVRVDPERNAELVARPGAEQAEMSGRDMGPAWITVDSSAVETDSDLRFWVATAMEFNGAG